MAIQPVAMPESELDIVDSGRVTSPAPAGTNVLSDSSKSWGVNIHRNRLVRIIRGRGAGQAYPIESNSTSALVIQGSWLHALDTTSEYAVLSTDLAQILRSVFGDGSNVDLPTEFDQLKAALALALEASVDSGMATGGSNTTIVDTNKNWEPGMWTDGVAEVVIGGIHYLRPIVGNSADTITIAALPGGVGCAAGCDYALKRPLTLADISDRVSRELGTVDSVRKWGGVALTGRDISLDLANLDITLSAFRNALRGASAKDFTTLEADAESILGQLNITLAALRDAICAAAPHAKTLNDLYGYLARYAQLPTSLTAAGNLRQSVEEQAIALGIDIQARYPLKTTRDIAAPAANTDYYLPETGNIDLSNFSRSSWYIYATTNKPYAIYLEASLDGGTTWHKLEGYEIPVADFVLGTWNTIDCPLMLAETRLLVSTGYPAPEAISMAVIRKA